MHNKLFCCENIGLDHTLQAIQYEKKNNPKLFKRKVHMDTVFIEISAQLRKNARPDGQKS